MLRTVTIDKFCTESGYTADAVRSKIKRGDWLVGVICFKAPDGRILIDIEAYEKWAKGETSAAPTRAASACVSDIAAWPAKKRSA